MGVEEDKYIYIFMKLKSDFIQKQISFIYHTNINIIYWLSDAYKYVISFLIHIYLLLFPTQLLKKY